LSKLGKYFGTTSGIEPAFLVEYKRRKKGNPGDIDFRTDFVDQSGDHWQEYTVYHSGFQMWKDISGKTKFEESPYNKATSNDVDWVQSVKLQAAAQKWVCHAISKTCNVPANTTAETVDKIYREAYKSGCKGFTVYRDGCRTGVLVSNSEKVTHVDAPKRPKTLPCEVHQLTSKGHKFMVFIGMFDGNPYEVMAYENGAEKHGKFGKITKVKRGIYRADLDDGTVIDSIADNCKPEEETITRLVSTSLRHGADISFIVHQLEKTEGEMNSFSKCLARVLKKYIKDGTKVSGDECPECKSNDLVRADGCKQCSKCGWTACN
jgi:ribonucleoside-diphosphate reductase alpha chain